ncbi:MAG: T9SS type A sorting domain-containing protein, partial [Bacteroidota bacterium]
MKTILTIALIITMINIEAQQPAPLQISGSGWRYIGEILQSSYLQEDVYTFIFNGDTNINSKLFHKYYYSLVQYDGSYPGVTVINKDYNGCLRSEDEKVYYIRKDSLNEILLYDYSLTIGDTVPQGLLNAGTNYIITDTMTIQMGDGSYRMKYTLNHWDVPYFIYGIGYFTGLLPIDTFIIHPYDDTAFVTYCENGNRVYFQNVGGLGHANWCDFPVAIAEQADNRQTDNLVPFPNPATNEFIVTIPAELLNEKQLTLRLYNFLGELIHNELVITAGGKITMNVEAYATGLYQVSL